jgi:hypothetical protein
MKLKAPARIKRGNLQIERICFKLPIFKGELNATFNRSCTQISKRIRLRFKVQGSGYGSGIENQVQFGLLPSSQPSWTVQAGFQRGISDEETR